MVQPDQPVGADPAAAGHRLFTSPLDLGPLTLRNRLVMGSMHVGLEDRHRDLDAFAAYLARRAAGGAALLVTGGYSPDLAGRLTPVGSTMARRRTARGHRRVTAAVHDEGAHIVLQLLHAGRYGYHPLTRAPSASRSPITPFRARALSARGVARTIGHYVRAARLAQRAGYDGVEVMGSEGYLLNQFLAERVNRRTDAWGGSARARMRMPVEVVRRIRAATGPGFLIQYRISLLDLVEGGQDWAEILELAGRLAEAGVDVFNTGIGWHEARVPTIVTSVPRAAFADLSGRLRREAGVTVCASNRINDPDVAEAILARGDADLISMARPLLADPDLMAKTMAGRTGQINTCIACNQACLDHVFANKRASCLVNPLAGRELALAATPPRAAAPARVAVLGAGVAGLAFAEAAAGRGHAVEVFEAADAIGGQFRLAARIPGKEEYAQTLRYFDQRLAALGVPVHLGRRAGVAELAGAGFDRVVVATGVRPRVPEIEGVDHPMVMRYDELLSGARRAGRRVAVLGAGGIGVDVAQFLTRRPDRDVAVWRRAWGVGDPAAARAGLVERAPHAQLPDAIDREVHLLQRKSTRIGAGLGKTTGWVHRAELRAAGVVQHAGVAYRRIDDAGLHITVDGAERVLAVDSVVLCTGQVSELAALGGADAAGAAAAAGIPVDVIGGADVAAELDAKRAIRQAVDLALSLG